MATKTVSVRVEHFPYEPGGTPVVMDTKEMIVGFEIEGNKKAGYLVIVKDPA